MQPDPRAFAKYAKLPHHNYVPACFGARPFTNHADEHLQTLCQAEPMSSSQHARGTQKLVDELITTCIDELYELRNQLRVSLTRNAAVRF